MSGQRFVGGVAPFLLLLGTATAAEQPTPPSPPPVPAPAARTVGALSPESAAAASASFGKQASLHKRAQAARYAELGRRLFAKRQYEQSARQLAVAYAFDPHPELLFDLAQAFRRADQDLEALAVYQRLLVEQPQTPHLIAVNEELALLRAKTEEPEPEPELQQAARDHVDTAKQEFKKGRFLVSSEEFALAYAMRRLPRILFNIAQAYRRVGRPEDAYIIYSRFLDEEPQTPLLKEVASYQAELSVIAFKSPLHKRPWFWVVIGAGAAVLIAGSAGLAAGLSQDPPTLLGTNEISFGLSR